MEWVQVYHPLGSTWLSTLMAGTPILALLGLLAAGVAAHRAALAGLLTALAVAIWGYGMPTSAALSAAAYGAAYGLVPIGWIVVAAVFLYHLTVCSGQFEVIKRSVAAISPDQRMQALLIAFSFGSLLEGAAGFGTPVAVSAALLIGLGFSPLYAAGLALLANTSPVAFGALGTPIAMLSKVTDIDPMLLSKMAGRQLTPFSIIIPFWLVGAMAGWRGIKGSWPAILVSGGSFAVFQYVLSNYHGPSLVNVAGGVGSMVCLAVFLRFWQPKEIWRFPDAPEVDAKGIDALPPLGARRIAFAWMPWVFLSLIVFLWGWPSLRSLLNGGPENEPRPIAKVLRPAWDMPGLDKRVYRSPPVVRAAPGTDRAAEPERAVYSFNWLSTTGTSIFVAAILSACWLGIRPGLFFEQLLATLIRTRWALMTIACMLAVAFTTKYSGSDATLGLAFTKTGWMYPFFAPLLGWLGVALTGSDTSSNALFGSLQRITAEQLGLNPILTVTSNSTGGVMGKMIDAQSIVVAAVATEQSGSEGQILRFVFFHSLILAGLMGLLCLAQAYLWPWMIPAA